MAKGRMARGTHQGASKLIDGVGFNFESMHAFFQYVTPRRLAILDCLYVWGPASAEGLTLRLKIGPRSEVVKELKVLMRGGLVRKKSYGDYVVLWQAILISVNQSVRYFPTMKILNLPEIYLKCSARKYQWLLVEVNTRTIARGLPRFSCSILPDAL
jgi:hypothetical protein